MVATIEQLQAIGLTHGEARVYLALIELGSSTVGPVVKKSGVAYSNVYDILQRLTEKGLVTFIVKSKTRYFQPADPAFLRDYLEKKEEELHRNKKLVDELLPKIREMQHIKPEQEAEIYVGLAGLKAAYMKAINNFKGEWLWFYVERPEYSKDVELAYMTILEIMKKSGVRSKGITNELYKKSKLYRRFLSFQHVRFVDFPIPGNLEVIGDMVIIVSYKKPFTTYTIRSPAIAQDMRDYFYFVWNQAKKK